MIKSTVITTETGGEERKRFFAKIKAHANSYVTIGVHEGAGSYPGGPMVVEVALWNEFGTRSIPERSFLRSAITGSESLLNQWRIEAVKNIVEKNWPVEKALEMIGFRVQVLIQNKVKSNVPPPLALSTEKAKLRHGAAPVTLIDTGLLLRSITYKVYPG